MKKILMVGAEAMPFAATGGLGDVLGSLPAALAQSEELDVRVVMPLYTAVNKDWRAQMKLEATFTVNLAWREQYCGVFSLKKDNVTYYFIDNEYYFKRHGLYGFGDDGERYAYFCMAVMEMLQQLNFYPDVLHAHDWQAALSVVYLNCLYRQKHGYGKIRTVFTIHNIEYQGKYGFDILGDVFALGESEHSLMEHDGAINLMKAAIECADRVTTVSPRYAEEICTPIYSHGLTACLCSNKFKLRGILNGIDYSYYNPQTDKDIRQKYSYRSLGRKLINKTALQEELGLPVREDVPVLSIISRLASHKGLDLVSECVYGLLERNDIQLIVLGQGEQKFESFFAELEQRFPQKVRALLTYNRALSKRIYAASDIFLMPSKSEPCGLSQMIASRYGAIPVVRETGGLYDSIKPFWREGRILHGNGFTFRNYSSEELSERTEAALALYHEREMHQKFVTSIMRKDFSWKMSATRYSELYSEL
ncbi:MAG: glycogen synthase GlgA [Clostridia bacterium]|nr:glycogen synthase GlgA [Clostridia bacterium]